MKNRRKVILIGFLGSFVPLGWGLTHNRHLVVLKPDDFNHISAFLCFLFMVMVVASMVCLADD